MAPKHSEYTLDRLRRGDHALVLAVHARSERLREKFTARGIVPGVEVAVLSAGDPLLLKLDESRWALNREEAAAIEVGLLRSSRPAWWPFARKAPA